MLLEVNKRTRERIIFILIIISIIYVLSSWKTDCDEASIPLIAATKSEIHKQLKVSKFMLKYHEETLRMIDNSYKFARNGDFTSLTYGDVKMEFIIQQLSSSFNPTTICEVGFSTGTSTIFLLSLFPEARWVGFDQIPSTSKTHLLIDHLKYVLGEKGIFVNGDLETSIPLYKQGSPSTSCDIIHSNKKRMKYSYLFQLKKLSHKNTIVLIDSVSSIKYIKGEETGQENDDDISAYHLFHKEGKLEIINCLEPFPVPSNTICIARFV